MVNTRHLQKPLSTIDWEYCKCRKGCPMCWGSGYMFFTDEKYRFFIDEDGKESKKPLTRNPYEQLAHKFEHNPVVQAKGWSNLVRSWRNPKYKLWNDGSDFLEAEYYAMDFDQFR